MATGDRKDPFRSFNFLVEIDGIARAGFRECSGLDSSQDPMEYREGNEGLTARKLPGLNKYSNISLKWGITDDHNVFTRYGVPAVLLIDFERRIPGRPQQNPTTDFHQWWHTSEDDLPAMDADALAFTGNLLWQALPELETFVLGRK